MPSQKPLSSPGETSTSGQVSKLILELRLEVPEKKVYNFRPRKGCVYQEVNDYCDKCQKLFINYCPSHGPPRFVKDRTEAKGHSKRAAPLCHLGWETDPQASHCAIAPAPRKETLGFSKWSIMASAKIQRATKPAFKEDQRQSIKAPEDDYKVWWRVDTKEPWSQSNSISILEDQRQSIKPQEEVTEDSDEEWLWWNG